MNRPLGKKIRESSKLQYNFVCVVGKDEKKDGLVDVRDQKDKRMGKFPVDEFVDYMKGLEPVLSLAE